jgi:quinol monooxygenase YgiN
MSVKVVARDKFQIGKKEEVLEIFREMVELTRKEKGCVSYTLHEALDDPDVLAMIEVWEDKESLDAHLESAHFKRLIPKITAHTAEPTRIEIFKEMLF